MAGKLRRCAATKYENIARQFWKKMSVIKFFFVAKNGELLDLTLSMGIA